jgi:muramoyltetrapeptide carboxypeptidase
MMEDKNIHAILFGRGGYGMGRIIDRLNFKKLNKNPKWLIGYSDITVLHSHLLKNYKIASLHAPMAGAFNDIENSGEYINALHDALKGKKAKYNCDPHPFNKKGDVTGILTGGNLALLANIIGTSSNVDLKNSILFIEDIGEYLYNADRMFYQLKRSGKFDHIAGLIIGGFTDMKDTDRPFGKTIYELIRDVIEEYDFPVCFGFPVSHTRENLALKIGVRYFLKISGKKTTLSEV